MIFRCSLQLRYKRGLDYPGNDLGEGTTQSSQKDCCAQWSQNEKCVAFASVMGPNMYEFCERIVLNKALERKRNDFRYVTFAFPPILQRWNRSGFFMTGTVIVDYSIFCPLEIDQLFH